MLRAARILRPLVPSTAEERFEQGLELEWPIEGLEPLSFVLGRVLDPLSAHLERRDRGAAVLHVRLRLVTRDVHERSLQLPVPMRDARTLRTLLLLDLESHPPPAAIDRVTVSRRSDARPCRAVFAARAARFRHRSSCRRSWHASRRSWARRVAARRRWSIPGSLERV